MIPDFLSFKGNWRWRKRLDFVCSGADTARISILPAGRQRAAPPFFGKGVSCVMFFQKKSGGVQWLLVCLGNPGKEYANTRHNIGFLAADALEKRTGVKFNKLKYRALTGEVTLGGQRVLVVKPQTYMNLSGEAVKLAGGFYKIPPERILVLYDDVSLPLGKLRIRASGSAGGHNGIKNIIAHLGTDAFPRTKVGVGAPEGADRDLVDWVIGNFTQSQRKVVDEAIDKALDPAECVIAHGISEAQNRFN